MLHELLTFLAANPILGFVCFALTLVLAFSVLALIISTPFKIWQRWMRHRTLQKIGWPPPYLDADGDPICDQCGNPVYDQRGNPICDRPANDESN